jgi:hypothetical protein
MRLQYAEAVKMQSNLKKQYLKVTTWALTEPNLMDPVLEAVTNNPRGY